MGTYDAASNDLQFYVLVPDYDGVSDRSSYLYLGAWSGSRATTDSPIGEDGFAQILSTASGDVVADASGTAYAGGDGIAIAAYVDGKPNLGTLKAAQRWDGDDMLWAFVYNRFRDDTRDRNVDSDDADETDTPAATVYESLAVQPYRPEVADEEEAADEEASADEEAEEEVTYKSPPYSKAQRQEMTTNIPNYVGWRDHTEGHRITTTRGDKVEVIGGNYKLIMLGRGAGTVQTDWSGGHLIDTLEAPGNVTSINYRAVPSSSGDDGWQWVEEVVKGNVIERFHGTFKEEFYGDTLISIIGHSGNTNAAVSTVEPPGHWDTSTAPNHEERNYWDSLEGTTFKLQRPEIIEKVRAKSVFEYQMSDYTDIGVFGANNIYDYIGCTFTSYNTKATGHHIPGDASYSDGSIKPSEIKEYFHAESIENTIHGPEWFEDIQVDLYMAFYNGMSGGVNANEIWYGVHQEYFCGTHTQVFGAVYTTVGLANRFELFIGFEEQFNLGLLLSSAMFEYDFKFTTKLSQMFTKSEAAVNTLRSAVMDTMVGLMAADLVISEQHQSALANLG